jgi:hypothetical protein
MKISGFTMCKNASKLYYPVKASIASILPIVDEFIVAVGDCDEDDDTLEQIKSIDSDKIKIIHTVWDIEKYPRGMENAHQTDIAKNACNGDWVFYLQADEVVHENDLQKIKDSCVKYLKNKNVDGLLFDYLHFYGDYNHFNNGRGWYQNEIRLVRNDKDIHSFQSAQSFRRIPNFDGLSYRNKEGTTKLNVVKVDAKIYHYGWVRPPRFMQKKKIALDSIHSNKNSLNDPEIFNYGPIGCLTNFKGTHPSVMKDWISKFDWAKHLNYTKKYSLNREKMKHEKIHYRIMNKIEKLFNNNRHFFSYSNWNIINHK